MDKTITFLAGAILLSALSAFQGAWGSTSLDALEAPSPSAAASPIRAQQRLKAPARSRSAAPRLAGASGGLQQSPSATFLQKSRAFHSPAEFAQITGGAVRLQKAAKPADELRIRRLSVHLPVNDFTVIARSE